MNSQQILSSAYLHQTVQSSQNKHSSAQPDDEFNHSFSTEQSSQTLDNNIQSKESCLEQQNKQQSNKNPRRANKKQAQERVKRVKEEKLAQMAAQEKEANRINASKFSEAFLPQFNKMNSKNIITIKSSLLSRKVFQWNNQIYNQPKKTPRTLFKKLQRELL